MKTWAEVADSAEFAAMPEADQEAARGQYFDQVVRPRVAAEDLDAARAQFDRETSVRRASQGAGAAPGPVAPAPVARRLSLADAQPAGLSGVRADIADNERRRREGLSPDLMWQRELGGMKPDPVKVEDYGMVSPEMRQTLTRQLGAMPRAERLAYQDNPRAPAWARYAAQKINADLDASDVSAERLKYGGQTVESRGRHLVNQGMEANAATNLANLQAQRGQEPAPLAQAKPDRAGLLSSEEESQARAEGKEMERRGLAARGFYQAEQGLRTGAAGGMAVALRALGDDEAAAMYEKKGQAAEVRAAASDELAQMRRSAYDTGMLASGPLTGVANFGERMATSAVNSIGQMAPGLAAAFAGQPGLGMTMMITPVFGQSYVKAREAGKSPGMAAAYAAPMAALEYVGERYGLLPAAMKALRTQAATKTAEELPAWADRAIAAMEKRGLFSKQVGEIVRTQVGEQIGEQITGAGQYLLDGTQFGLDKPISLLGFLENARDTAVQTLMATGAIQAGGYGVRGAMGRGGREAGAEGAPLERTDQPGSAPLQPAVVDAAAAVDQPQLDAAAALTGAQETAPAPAEITDDGTGLASDAHALPPAPAPGAAAAAEVAAPALETELDQRAHAAATSPTNELPEPTQAQKEAGNYKVGRARIAGMDISIENPQGSVRRGVSPDGQAWENQLQHHYGYIRGTLGNDGDHVDVFVKPGTQSDYAGRVYVVDQVDPKTGKFDEAKVMLGFASQEEAEQAYRANYAADWQGLADITPLPMAAFKAWVQSRDAKRPLGDLNARTQAAPADGAAPVATAQAEPSADPAGDARPAAAGGTEGGLPNAGRVGEAQAARVTAEAPAAEESEARLSVAEASAGAAPQPRFRPSRDAQSLAAAKALQKFVDRATGSPGRHQVVAVDVDSGSSDLRAARALARQVFGQKVVFVEQPTGNLFDGIIHPNAPDTLVLNANSTRPVMAVLGHELLHRLRATSPGVYQGLKQRLDAVMTSNDAYAQKLNAARARRNMVPLDADVLAEERIADVVGDFFTDKGFWRAMAQQEPSGFRRIANAVLNFIDDALAKATKRRPFGSERYIVDLKAARAAVADAMLAFSKARASEATPAEERMSLPEDGAAAPGASTGWTGKDEDGNPIFGNDRVVLAHPIDVARFEVIPVEGQKVQRFLIMPAEGFDVFGQVDLLMESDKPVSLLDIEVYPGAGKGRQNGVGRAAVEAVVDAADGDLNISNIVSEARGFWEKLGVPRQDLPDGHAYEGTLNGNTITRRTGNDAAGVRSGAAEAEGEGRGGDAGEVRGDPAGEEAGGARQGEGISGGSQEAEGLNDDARLSLSKDRYTDEEREALARAGLGGQPSTFTRLRSSFGRALDMVRDRQLLTDTARQAVLDQFHGIKRAVETEIGALPVDQDPYIAARLANGGTSSVMRALMLHGQARWADNMQHLERIPETKGLLDILAPLGDDLNAFFGWMVGNRAARLFKEGREHNFTEDQIRTLQGLAKDRRAEFVKIAAEYSQFKRSVLDVAEKAGLIDPVARKTWDHADYIPFYRQLDKTQFNIAGGKSKAVGVSQGRRGLAGQSSGIRTLRGGTSALNDPLENLLMNFSRLVDASLKNNALRKTIDLLEEGKSEIIEKTGYAMKGVVVPAAQVRQVLEEAGTPSDVLDTIPPEAFEGMAKMWSIQAPTDPDVVRIMRDGKPSFYRVKDPLLLRAVTSFVPFNFFGLGAMRFAKRLLTSMVTASPDFMIRNFIRDTLATSAIARDAIDPSKSVRGAVNSFLKAGGHQDMLFAGASFQSGNINAGDPAATGAAIRRALRSKKIGAASTDKAVTMVIDTPAKLWDAYRHVGETLENTNREAVYQATLNAGKGATAAAFEAKDLMDFNLRGSAALYQAMADVLPFFNARVQGLYRLGRADPKRLMMVGTIMMTLSLLLAFQNDGEDWYEELPDYEKDTYWHFRIGGAHFKLPKPFEIGVIFATIPERLGRNLKKNDDFAKTKDRLWANVRDQLAFDIVPQIIRPMVDVSTNHDNFRDRKIENLADEGKLPRARYDGQTSATMRLIAEAGGDITDATGLGPKRLEHLLKGYFGTIGTYALGISDYFVKIYQGKPDGPALRLDDFPIVKSFYAADPARATVYESDLYKLHDVLQETANTVKAYAREGELEKQQDITAANLKKLAAAPVVDKATKVLKALGKARDAILADKEMSPEEKRRRVDELQVKRNELAKKIMTTPAVAEAKQ